MLLAQQASRPVESVLEAVLESRIFLPIVDVFCDRCAFEHLEEGDRDPVHWRMELTTPGKASLDWVELPKGLKLKPIGLAKDAGNSGPVENEGGTRSKSASAAQKAEYVLGDLKIEGVVHDGGSVRDRVLKQLAGQEFDDLKDLVEAVAQRGVRSDFQSRGYFKVVVQDPTSKPLGESGEAADPRRRSGF